MSYVGWWVRNAAVQRENEARVNYTLKQEKVAFESADGEATKHGSRAFSCQTLNELQCAKSFHVSCTGHPLPKMCNLADKISTKQNCAETLKVINFNRFISNLQNVLQKQTITYIFLAAFGWRLTLAGLLSVLTTASHWLICNHKDCLTHCLLILERTSSYVCILQKGHKVLPIEMPAHLKDPALVPSVTPSLPLSLSFSCFTQDVRMSLSNGSMQKRPLLSSLLFICVFAVGWELTANKKSSLSLTHPTKKYKKGDWSILRWVVCFPPFCALFCRFWPLLMWP